MTPDGVVVSPPGIPNYGIDNDRVLGRDPLVAAVHRRLTGRYAVDEFGGDPHLQDFLVAPVAGRIPMRIEGGVHLPTRGPALLVSNHTPRLVEPLVLMGAVQRTVARRLRVAGLAGPSLLGVVTHKLGGVGGRGGDVAAVLRAGHLAAVPLARTWWGTAAGDAPRGVLAATLGVPVLPVALALPGRFGLPGTTWSVRIGAPVLPPEGTEPDDPLAAAELAEAVRSAVAGMLGAVG